MLARSLLLLLLASGAAAQTPTAPRDSSDSFVCFVEQAPVLIGGLKGVQERLVYPPMQESIAGTVFVQITVTRSGGVKDPACVRSPHPLMCEAAIDAVKGSRFEPATQCGKPVAVGLTLPVRFDLR